MKVSVVQPDLAWEDKPGNLKTIGELVRPLYNKTDLVVLPEMFNTGFSMNPEKLSELPNAETFSWMKSIAESGNFGLCGSYMIKEKNHYFNRWVFVSPEKEYWYYDKRHLFSMGSEDKYFSPGKTRITFSFRGIKISPFICYDLRFPVWSRNRNDYDLLINAANWPESRRDVWITLLKARAIENQCYVAGSNRIGTDGNNVNYCGESMIINPFGKTIASANRDEEGIITCDLSIDELNEFRKKFPVSDDADDFTINII
jgi:omega-amidase